MLGAPGDVREAKLQPAQRAAHGNVGQPQVDATVKRPVAQPVAQGNQAGIDLGHLAIHPGLRALGRCAARKGVFQAHQNGRVEHAIGQRLPGLDLGALAARRGNQLAHGREGVEVFHNHARIKQRLAPLHQQARHFAQRIGGGNAGAIAPDIVQHELVIQLFFGHDNAHFAHVGAGGRSDQFHGVLTKAGKRCKGVAGDSIEWTPRYAPACCAPYNRAP